MKMDAHAHEHIHTHACGHVGMCEIKWKMRIKHAYIEIKFSIQLLQIEPGKKEKEHLKTDAHLIYDISACEYLSCFEYI